MKGVLLASAAAGSFVELSEPCRPGRCLGCGTGPAAAETPTCGPACWPPRMSCCTTDTDGAYGPSDVDRVVQALASAPAAIETRPRMQAHPGPPGRQPDVQPRAAPANRPAVRRHPVRTQGLRRQAGPRAVPPGSLGWVRVRREVLLARRLGRAVAEVQWRSRSAAAARLGWAGWAPARRGLGGAPRTRPHPSTMGCNDRSARFALKLGGDSVVVGPGAPSLPGGAP